MQAQACVPQTLVRHRTGRYRPQLAGLQGFDADGAAVEAHELDEEGGTLVMNMDDYAYVTRLQRQRQRWQRAGQHHLIVFLHHRISWVGGRFCLQSVYGMGLPSIGQATAS